MAIQTCLCGLIILLKGWNLVIVVFRCHEVLGPCTIPHRAHSCDSRLGSKISSLLGSNLLGSFLDELIVVPALSTNRI